MQFSPIASVLFGLFLGCSSSSSPPATQADATAPIDAASDDSGSSGGPVAFGHCGANAGGSSGGVPDAGCEIYWTNGACTADCRCPEAMCHCSGPLATDPDSGVTTVVPFNCADCPASTLTAQGACGLQP